MRNVLEKLTVFQFMPTLYHDHENFSKSTTIFIQTFIKTLVILRVTKHFLGKLWVILGKTLCVSLFNNYIPFSIKKSVKFNTVLLFVSKVAKIPWFRKDLQHIFLKNQHCWNLIRKCTTMQIEKVLKNDR